MKPLTFQSPKEVFYLVLKYILHVASAKMFYQEYYCFRHEYQGLWYCSEPRIVDFCTEDEVYTIRFEPGKLISLFWIFSKT